MQERRAALEKELQGLRGQEQGLLGDVERLEVELSLRREQLGEAQIVLQRTSAQMDATLRRLRALAAELDTVRPVLVARARALYKLGDMSYLRLLLSVERPADFVRGYRFVTSLARQDRERVATFRKGLDALDATRVELDGRAREAERQKAGLEQARRALDEERRRKTALLTRIVERKEAQAAYLEELKEAEKALDRLVGGLEAAEVEVPMALLRGSLPWPAGGRLRSGFGRHKHPRFDTYTVQNGIEIEADPGTGVHAVHEGVVAFADRFRGYGLMVVLDHGGKHHTLYARLAELKVGVGDRVHAGDVLGMTGTYGIEEPGLYFEVRSQGHPENPAEWLGRR